jgi:hypothetical protein
MSRNQDLDRLYELLEQLEARLGGFYRLDNCDGYMDWPERGVYFFFAADEDRSQGSMKRLTRIGTHAVSNGSGASLWNRLRTHRGHLNGSYPGGGNHRGSVFRKRVGEALIEREEVHDQYPEWGIGNSAKSDLRESEHDHEQQVSEFIRSLPFLYVAVPDDPGPESDRAYLEQNAIALVSNFESETFDPRSDEWLGRHSPSAEILESGLWNVNHVGEYYDPTFLNRLEEAVEATEPA